MNMTMRIPDYDRKIAEEFRNYLDNNRVRIPGLQEQNDAVMDAFRGHVRRFLQVSLRIPEIHLLPQILQEQLKELEGKLIDNTIGFGPLQPFLKNRSFGEGHFNRLEEVIVRNGSILVEAGGNIQVVEDNTRNAERQKEINEQFTSLAHRLTDDQKQPISISRPHSVISIPGTGDRFAVIIPPLSQSVAINVRLFPTDQPFSILDLQSKGAFTPANAEKETSQAYDIRSGYFYQLGKSFAVSNLLESLAEDDRQAAVLFEKMKKANGKEVALFLAAFIYYGLGSLMISGEFSSGKTTLLKALTQFIPRRVLPVTIEDYAELRILHPFGLELITNRLIPQGFVINNVLTRMRPDIIIVGEMVEKDQAHEFLNAANLGKRVASTIHAGNAEDALLRLETLAISENYTPAEVRRRIAGKIQLVVHMSRHDGERFVNEIVMVGERLTPSGEYDIVPIYQSNRISSRSHAIQELWYGIKEAE